MKALKCTLFAVMSMLLVGCPTMQPKHLAQPVPVQVTGAYTQSASGITFPEAVGDFHRTSVIRYDSEGLDVSAGYDLFDPPRAIAATVYVYPAPPLVSIGSPPEVVASARANLCDSEFKHRKQEILQSHAGAILIQEGGASLSQGGKMYSGMAAMFDYEEVFAGKRQPLRSEIYLFCYVGGKWAIKYRFSHPKSFDDTNEIENFMRNLSWTLMTP